MWLILVMIIFNINENNSENVMDSANETIDDSMQRFCRTNTYVLLVKHVFTVDNVYVFFLQDYDEMIYVFKLRGLRFNESVAPEDQLTFRSIEEWPQWNHYSNGTVVTQISKFLSVYRFVLPDNSSPLIFTTLAMDEKSYIAYEVQYDRYVSYIVSVKQFTIDIHNVYDVEDRLNLRDFYQNFPINSEKLAKPVMSLPISSSFHFPQRAFVYYSELNPDFLNAYEMKNKVHIIKQQSYSNGTIEWIFDEQSGECFDLVLGNTMDNHIEAVVPITGYIGTDNGTHFYMIEFDDFYQYAIRKISLATDGTIKPSSFNQLRYDNEIRELFLCKQSDPSIPEDTFPPEVTDREISVKVYVFMVLILLAIIAAIALATYWYIQTNETHSWPPIFRRRSLKTPPESIEMTKKATPNSIEMGENVSQPESDITSSESSMRYIDDSDISTASSSSQSADLESDAANKANVAESKATQTGTAPLQSSNVEAL